MMTKLLSFFPDPSAYHLYLDAYGGSGGVLLAKPQAQVEVYNDLNDNAYALFKVLVDPLLFVEFRRCCELALFNETLSDELNHRLSETSLTLVERAFAFWYVARTRFSGNGGFSINPTVRRRMSKSTSDFLSSVEMLPALHERLSSVIVCHQDALDLIAHYDHPGTLMYLDPPYVQSTRGDTRYETDADDSHHRALVTVLQGLQHAQVVLSGYPNPIYEGLTHFEQEQFQVHTVDGKNNPKTKTETIWRNFVPTTQRLF